MTTTRPLHGLLLAGGRSRRMGTDKSALVHPDGRPLGRRTLDLLTAACSRTIVSIRRDQAIPPGITESPTIQLVSDPEGDSHGPLTGIITAMSRFPEANWLVVACDLPRLDAETLHHLVASCQPGESFLAYRSEFDGLPEPLCAFYAAEALPVLKQSLDNQIRCPRKILIQQSCRLLDPVSPHALDNANTPQDWQNVNAT